MNIDSQIMEIIRVLSTTRNESLISQIQRLIQDTLKDNIVGYEPDGTPITQEDFLISLQQSKSDAANGNTYSGDELIAHFSDKAQNG